MKQQQSGLRIARVGSRCGTLVRRGVVTIALLAAAACTGGAGTRSEARGPITVDSVRLTAAGHYVDLRYRVLDPTQANEMLGPDVKPVLVNDATGATMGVPMTAKLGPLRQTQGPQRTDRQYFILFVNSGGLVPGSKVSARIGDIHIGHLTVE